ncbi:MAG TPA: response regulator [Vicinamibacterales bacterium]|jgi:two-component system phosphate regulon response regulator PhoB
MSETERRGEPDRRRVPRGGRRPYDRPGRYPPLLVADSYEGARRPCARYLERLNFDVSEADSGEEALQRILQSPPRLILAEWSLPSMPGGKLTQWLSQGFRTRGIPVIIIANATDPSVPVPSVAGILRKPFTLAQMIEEIRRVLRATDRFSTMQSPPTPQP